MKYFSIMTMALVIMVAFCEVSQRQVFKEQATLHGALAHEADMFCGPRCTQYLLEFFHVKIELSEIVGDLQFPEIEKGISLSDIQRYLHRNGIFARTVSLPKGHAINCENPVVVHFPGDSQHDSLGHFAVWLPRSKADVAVVWNGLQGVERIPTREFYDQISPIILVASSRRVEQMDCTLPIRSNGLLVTKVAFAVCWVLAVGAFFAIGVKW